MCSNRNRKLEISRAPTKAKSREPAYSQAPNQNKIDRQRSKAGEAGRQSDGYGRWCLELRRGRGVWGSVDHSSSKRQRSAGPIIVYRNF